MKVKVIKGGTVTCRPYPKLVTAGSQGSPIYYAYQPDHGSDEVRGVIIAYMDGRSPGGQGNEWPLHVGAYKDFLGKITLENDSASS